MVTRMKRIGMMFIMMITKVELLEMEQREANKPTVDAFLVERKLTFAFFQELEAKLEASRLREEKLVAEVESVRVVSIFQLTHIDKR